MLLGSALLLTKLSRPQTRPTLVARPRLRQLLLPAETHPLTLICAPAGYGKTTLILAWLGEEKRVAWLSLDESDNDPVRFWTYMIAALQTAALDRFCAPLCQAILGDGGLTPGNSRTAADRLLPILARIPRSGQPVSHSPG
ncbi:MAG: hypothetical protein Fur0021_18540 [Candidatus Promineifilaceae bacterium]